MVSFDHLTELSVCQVYVKFVLQHSKPPTLIEYDEVYSSVSLPLRPFNRSDMTSFFSVDSISVFIH